MKLDGIKKFIREALTEADGSPSSLRLNMFIGFTQWSAAMTVGFFYVLIAQPGLILGYLGILSALTGGLVGLKVTQRNVEGKYIQSTSDPTSGQDGASSSTEKSTPK